jgi:hypothetical protein
MLGFILLGTTACSLFGVDDAPATSRLTATPTAQVDRSAPTATAAPIATEQRAATEDPTAAPEPTERAPEKAVRPAKATLALRYTPKSATIRVDGRQLRRGATSVRLAPGKHTILVQARVHKSKRAVVRLRPGQTVRVTYTLKPVPAPLIVKVGAKRAQVYLDGKLLGRGSKRRNVAPGRHTVRVTLPGYKRYMKRVILRPAATRQLNVRLQPKSSRIIVGAAYQGAVIRVDGRWGGIAPRTVYRLRPGQHTLRVQKRGYRTIVRQMQLRPDQAWRLEKRLVRIPRPRRVVTSTGSSAPLRHRPLAVMVENHPNARPQSGLDYADVVLEAPAEFGISRFIAFFISRDAPAIGPVRSARSYFVAWAKEFNPLYFHAGGSPGAAAYAREIGLSRTNALWDATAFYRTSDRVAPHNLYTSTQRLLARERALGKNTSNGTWGGLRFKQPGTQLGPRSVSYARLAFNDYYFVEWRWNPSAGVYTRSMQGEPAIERNTGNQITATAVIVRVHQVSRIAGDDKAREEVEVVGGGTAYILQDGRMTPATWRKDGINGPTLYYDQLGNRIAFNKGGIWIQVIPDYGNVDLR